MADERHAASYAANQALWEAWTTVHATGDFYDLEGLWHEAPRVPLEIPAEAKVGAEPIY